MSECITLCPVEAIVRWVLECQRPGGGFGGSPRHDPHLLYTTSGMQILALYDRLDAVVADETAACELHHLVSYISPISYLADCNAHTDAHTFCSRREVARRRCGEFTEGRWLILRRRVG